jgi:hypothetical protein
MAMRCEIRHYSNTLVHNFVAIAVFSRVFLRFEPMQILLDVDSKFLQMFLIHLNFIGKMFGVHEINKTISLG